ncbi:MAG TPA: CAP domain-containing protein [Actinomycetota bacterium]|nr:CAP domain-containing protein [Actinomycetota bacterium]
MLGSLVLAVGMLIPLLQVPAATAAPTRDSTCYSYSGGELKMARRVNRSRDHHSLRKYRLDPELSRAATVHSKVMQRRKTLFHTNDLGSKITNWTLLGEAVVAGRSIKRMHRRLMESAVHRALILHSGFEFFGVGIYRKGSGKRWVTIIFSAGGNPGTTFKMPSC